MKSEHLCKGGDERCRILPEGEKETLREALPVCVRLSYRGFSQTADGEERASSFFIMV